MAPTGEETPAQLNARAERLEDLAATVRRYARQYRGLLAAPRRHATPRTWRGEFARRSTDSIAGWQRDLEGAAQGLDDTADFYCRKARELRTQATTAGPTT